MPGQLKLQIHIYSNNNVRSGVNQTPQVKFLEMTPGDVSLEDLSIKISNHHSRLYKRPLHIYKIQDGDGNDLDLTYKVDDVFTDKSVSSHNSIVRIVEYPLTREASVPPESGLRSRAWGQPRQQSIFRAMKSVQALNNIEEGDEESREQGGFMEPSTQKRQRIAEAAGARREVEAEVEDSADEREGGQFSANMNMNLRDRDGEAEIPESSPTGGVRAMFSPELGEPVMQATPAPRSIRQSVEITSTNNLPAGSQAFGVKEEVLSPAQQTLEAVPPADRTITTTTTAALVAPVSPPTEPAAVAPSSSIRRSISGRPIFEPSPERDVQPPQNNGRRRRSSSNFQEDTFAFISAPSTGKKRPNPNRDIYDLFSETEEEAARMAPPKSVTKSARKKWVPETEDSTSSKLKDSPTVRKHVAAAAKAPILKEAPAATEPTVPESTSENQNEPIPDAALEEDEWADLARTRELAAQAAERRRQESILRQEARESQDRTFEALSAAGARRSSESNTAETATPTANTSKPPVSSVKKSARKTKTKEEKEAEKAEKEAKAKALREEKEAKRKAEAEARKKVQEEEKARKKVEREEKLRQQKEAREVKARERKEAAEARAKAEREEREAKLRAQQEEQRIKEQKIQDLIRRGLSEKIDKVDAARRGEEPGSSPLLPLPTVQELTQLSQSITTEINRRNYALTRATPSEKKNIQTEIDKLNRMKQKAVKDLKDTQEQLLKQVSQQQKAEVEVAARVREHNNALTESSKGSEDATPAESDDAKKKLEAGQKKAETMMSSSRDNVESRKAAMDKSSENHAAILEAKLSAVAALQAAEGEEDEMDLTMEVETAKTRENMTPVANEMRPAERKKALREAESAKKAAERAEQAKKRAEREVEKAREKAEKEAEKTKKEAEKEAEKARKVAEKEAEQARKKAEKEQARLKAKAEKEAQAAKEKAEKEEARLKAKAEKEAKTRADRLAKTTANQSPALSEEFSVGESGTGKRKRKPRKSDIAADDSTTVDSPAKRTRLGAAGEPSSTAEMAPPPLPVINSALKKGNLKVNGIVGDKGDVSVSFDLDIDQTMDNSFDSSQFLPPSQYNVPPSSYMATPTPASLPPRKHTPILPPPLSPVKETPPAVKAPLPATKARPKRMSTTPIVPPTFNSPKKKAPAKVAPPAQESSSDDSENEIRPKPKSVASSASKPTPRFSAVKKTTPILPPKISDDEEEDVEMADAPQQSVAEPTPVKKAPAKAARKTPVKSVSKSSTPITANGTTAKKMRAVRGSFKSAAIIEDLDDSHNEAPNVQAKSTAQPAVAPEPESVQASDVEMEDAPVTEPERALSPPPMLASPSVVIPATTGLRSFSSLETPQSTQQPEAPIEDPLAESEEDIPTSAQPPPKPSPHKKTALLRNPVVKPTDPPSSPPVMPQLATVESKPATATVESSSEESSSEDDEFSPKKAPTPPKSVPKKAAPHPSSDGDTDSSTDEEPAAKPAHQSSAPSTVTKPSSQKFKPTPYPRKSLQTASSDSSSDSGSDSDAAAAPAPVPRPRSAGGRQSLPNAAKSIMAMSQPNIRMPMSARKPPAPRPHQLSPPPFSQSLSMSSQFRSLTDLEFAPLPSVHDKKIPTAVAASQPITKMEMAKGKGKKKVIESSDESSSESDSDSDSDSDSEDEKVKKAPVRPAPNSAPAKVNGAPKVGSDSDSDSSDSDDDVPKKPSGMKIAGQKEKEEKKKKRRSTLGFSRNSFIGA